MMATAGVLAMSGWLNGLLISESLEETKVPENVASNIDPEQMDLDISVGEVAPPPAPASQSPPNVAIPDSGKRRS